ncbi:S-layer homology domain-containing protein [Cohnella sp. GCM10027633]|uniref:S-layer homology domain-containing protein n=1 Tax=unclassified Cohnella TaxID=2636738 RepID=UPI00363C1211
MPSAFAADEGSAVSVTASYTYHGDRLEDAIDGIVSYDDTPKSRWTAYESPNATDWVQLEYASAKSNNTAGIYIFDDGGGIKAPSAYDVQYYDGSDWVSAPNQVKSPEVPAGNELNLVAFDAVTSTQFRVLFTHAGSKSGASEIVFADSNTEPVPGAAVSPLGVASASYTFRLDQVSDMNDGIVSYDAATGNRWTSYESPNASDWVQTNFGSPKRKDAVGIYLFADGGGIKAPTAYDVQYLNGSGEWESATGQEKTPAEPLGNALNLATFDAVEAQKFRVVFTHGDAKTGVTEIQYVDSATQSLPAPPSAGTASASYTNNGDSIADINDGIVSFSDFPRNRWTAYGSPNAADDVQTQYETAFSKNAAGIFIYDDGGGVQAPSAYDVQYWNGGDWSSVPGQVKSPAEPAANALNLVTFDTVISDRYRVVLTHKPGSYAGITEVAYVDTNKEPVPVAPPVVEVEPAIAIASPAIGATVSGTVDIQFNAPGMKNVWARVWHQPDAEHPDPNGYDAWLDNAALDDQGNGSITIAADRLPHGPMTVILNAWDSPEGDPNFTKSTTSYLQLYNAGGVEWKKGIPAAPAQTEGMRMLYEDDFSAPLSISKTGEGTRYASLKPDWPNGSEFGEAIFADPTDAVNPFSILDDDYLRIRVSKAPEGYVDPQGWNRKYIGGLLSSVRLDGTGIAATNGYFEARIQMPAGKGAWPAFWLMSQNSSGAGHLPSTAEIDTVEGYGHNPSGACQAKHWWAGNPESHATNCSSDNFAYGDSASTWHLYGTKITPTEVIYYIDNVEVWRHASFEQANTPMYFMLNLALGGGWPIDLAKYGDQIDMYVDYVRVFEPSGEEPTDPDPEPETNTNPGTYTPPNSPPMTITGDAVVFEPELSVNNGTVTAKLDATTWQQAKEKMISSGNRKISIEIKPSASPNTASGYVQQLPPGALSASDNPMTVEVRTPVATVELPSGMIVDEKAAAGEIAVHIERGNSDTLGEEAKRQIGERPVIELSLRSGGKTIEWNNPQTPVKVSIPYTPTAEESAHPDYIVVRYIDGAGNVIAVPNGRYDAAAGQVTFSVTHFSTYAVAYVRKTFDDIGSYGWAQDAIEGLASKGIINGTADNEFSPGKPITRAEFVAFLARTFDWQGANGKPFSDVPEDAYYAQPLAAARQLGIATGSGDNRFNPNDPITREQMMVLTDRALAAAKITVPQSDAADPSRFQDIGEVSAYAKDSVSALIRSGLIQGNYGSLRPKDTTTRAETAAMLYKLYNLLK